MKSQFESSHSHGAAGNKSSTDPDSPEARRERESLLLARERLLDQIRSAHDDRYRAIMARALDDIDRLLAQSQGATTPAMIAERLKRITIEEGKCGGRPCIRGMRIRVSDVLDLLASGAGHEEILADYPSLEREDILAAIEYAARQADHVVLQTP